MFFLQLCLVFWVPVVQKPCSVDVSILFIALYPLPSLKRSCLTQCPVEKNVNYLMPNPSSTNHSPSWRLMVHNWKHCRGLLLWSATGTIRIEHAHFLNILAAYVGDANKWLFNSKNCKMGGEKRRKKDSTPDHSKLIMQGYRGKKQL